MAGHASASLAAARVQGQEILDVSLLVPSLGAADIASLLAVRIKSLLPSDSVVVFCPKDRILIAEFGSGENASLLSTVRVPVGEGLRGWVAENHKPTRNGPPKGEAVYVNESGHPAFHGA